jgi:hypothetical protein
VKQCYKDMIEYLHENGDDLEYLLFVGVPAGIILILLQDCLNFVNLF